MTGGTYHGPEEQPEQELKPPGLEPDYAEETYRGSGGDSGIGRAVVFAREEPDAKETTRVVEDAGRKAVEVPGDIGDEAQCQGLVERAISEFGKLDVLIRATMPAEFVSQFGRQESPMGRAAEPAHVLLASQEASYVNGETLSMTGGPPTIGLSRARAPKLLEIQRERRCSRGR